VVAPVATEIADAPAKPKRRKAVAVVAPVATEIADAPAKPKRRKAVKSVEAVGDGEVSS